MRRWVRTAVAVVAVLAVMGTPTASAVSATSVRVERIAGGDRYETSSGVVREFTSDSISRVWLVTGAGRADALAAGPAVARDGGALLLVPGHEPPTTERLARVHPLLLNLDRILLVGGHAAISAEWEDAARAAALAERSTLDRQVE